MGISINPYMTGSRKTAANMTWRELKGQQLFQKKRAEGQSNPSPEYIQAQETSAGLWQWSRWMAALIVYGWTTGLPKQGRKQAWYKKAWEVMLSAAVAPSAKTLVVADAYFSNGTMAQTAFTAAADASTGILTLTWDPSTVGFGKRASDRLVVGWWNGNALAEQIPGFSELVPATTTRTDGTVGLPYGADIWDAGNELVVYLGFVQAEDDLGPIEPGTGISSKSLAVPVTVVA